MRIAGTLALAAIALTVASTAGAVVQPHRGASLVDEVLVPYYDVGGKLELYLRDGTQSAGEASEISRRFGGGAWQFSWNTLTGTLHDLYGGAYRIAPGMLTSREQVDRVARDFLARHEDLLGARAGELALHEIVNGNGKWYVRYRQVVDGIPVYKALVKLQITEDGRLVRLGSDFHPYLNVPPADVTTSAARAAALEDVPFNPATDRVEERGLLILPVPAGDGDVTAAEYHLVHDFRVVVAEGPGQYETFVDARTGEVLRRFNDIRHVALNGTVEALVDEETYCIDPPVDLTMEDLRVVVTDVGTVYTDETGFFTIDVPDGLPKPVEFKLRGLHCATYNQDPGGSSAIINTTGTPGTPLDVYWDDTNSTPAERDCYYHQNRIYDYMKEIVGGMGLSGLEGSFPCNVNINNSCNAFWNGSSINFYQAGGGCGNTGEISDVVYHEYGHGLDNALGFGLSGPQLSEGIPDIFSTILTDQYRVGRGFYQASCFLVLRNCQNSLRYPQNLTGEPYGDGEILCGMMWNLHQNLMASGLPVSHRDSLFTFSVLADPPNQPEFVTQLFIEDDDDGVLNNGTPNYDDICDAAQLHGYSCPEIFEGVIINHQPYGDTANITDPYELTAVIGTTDPGGMDSTYVFYSVDMAGFTGAPMTPTGNPAEYTFAIPAQPEGSLIRYYILGADFAGHRATSPVGAPGLAHSIVVSSTGLTTLDSWDMETEAGWTVGDELPQLPDDATAGIWERGDPIGVVVYVGGQAALATPEDDTTPAPGVNCWFTEQEVPGEQAGAHDVDGGKTTLRSPVFDISGEQFLRLSYNRWFTNALGNNKSEDPFQVGLSTNGGLSYVTIEETLISASSWVETKIDLNGVAPFGNNMRLRFVARDNETGDFGPSLVEAAIDDVAIKKWPIGTNAVDDALAGTVPLSFALGQNSPNPFNPATAIDYVVAESGQVQLRVFNVSGQLVRTLVDTRVEAGEYSVAWDGRNDQGMQVPTGVYYYRIDAPAFSETRKMVLLK
ncbi:MAG: FlgD immunoglobulin-like domain containing protein [Candidatus Eiseniibacteriota bacterium]|jgi:Zn-dependent metalloprotease